MEKQGIFPGIFGWNCLQVLWRDYLILTQQVFTQQLSFIECSHNRKWTDFHFKTTVMCMLTSLNLSYYTAFASFLLCMLGRKCGTFT